MFKEVWNMIAGKKAVDGEHSEVAMSHEEMAASNTAAEIARAQMANNEQALEETMEPIAMEEAPAEVAAQIDMNKAAAVAAEEEEELRKIA